MTEAKPDKPARSVFVPVLIAGTLIAIALFATLVPLRVCPRAMIRALQVLSEYQGANTHGPRTIHPDSPKVIACPDCDDRGKVPLLNIWRKDRLCDFCGRPGYYTTGGTESTIMCDKCVKFP